jgi:hypothetical protein
VAGLVGMELLVCEENIWDVLIFSYQIKGLVSGNKLWIS